MADDPLSRLGAAFSGPLFPFLPGLPAMPTLGSSGLPDVDSLLGQAHSGFPSFGGGGSGFPTFGGNTSSGFDTSFRAPDAYDRSEGILNNYNAQQRASLTASLNPDIPGNALNAYQFMRQQQLKQSGQVAKTVAAASPDTLTEPMLADAPANVARWYGLAKKYADQYKVPVEDIMAIIENESGGQPGARSGENPGQGRAVGLMQLIPMYHGTDGADLTDPETNIQRGVRYYASGYHAHGDDSRKGMANFFGGGGAFDANGNVREDIGDINIKMGPYLDGKFLPAKQRWAARLANGAPSSVAGASSAQSAGALNIAAHQLGKPYVFGGADERGFDCSGLIQWAYAQNGKQVGRTAQDQWNHTQRLTTNQVAPGDLVFFKNTYNAGTPITHVGIYAGGGRMVMATSETSGIKYVSITDPYWQQHLAGYGRVQ